METNYPMIEEYYNMVKAMKAEFNSNVFGKEKDGNFKSSVAQISKGMGDDDFYPTIEEKAAMLLYLNKKSFICRWKQKNSCSLLSTFP